MVFIVVGVVLGLEVGKLPLVGSRESIVRLHQAYPLSPLPFYSHGTQSGAGGTAPRLTGVLRSGHAILANMRAVLSSLRILAGTPGTPAQIKGCGILTHAKEMLYIPDLPCSQVLVKILGVGKHQAPSPNSSNGKGPGLLVVSNDSLAHQ